MIWLPLVMAALSRSDNQTAQTVGQIINTAKTAKTNNLTT